MNPVPMPRRIWPRLLAGLGLLLGALTVAVAWLLASESGLLLVGGLAEGLSGGRLVLAQGSGRLLGPLGFGEVAWHDGGDRMRLQGVALDWQPAELLAGRLVVTNLAAERLQLDLAPSPQAPRLPTSLRLPLAVAVENLTLGEVRQGGGRLAGDLAASLSFADGHYRLHRSHARVGGVSLQAVAKLAADAPFALQARAELAGQLAEHPFRLAVTADGSLAAIELRAASRDGLLQGMAQATATPFSPHPIRQLLVDLRGLDPAAWIAGAPRAELDVVADLAPRGGDVVAIAGSFAVTNRAAGPFDRDRLPLARLAGRLLWREAGAELSGLQLAVPGGGSLRGEGRWADGTLRLDLAAERLDAAALHGNLKPTRLAGPVSARLGSARQELALDLVEPRFAVKASGARIGERVQVEALGLQAGAASLQAKGFLDLGQALAFAVEGELQRFDPARFAKVPPARINARFTASGSLRPRWAVQAHVGLQDSQWAGQALAGSGDVDVRWPEVRKADLQLSAGSNRLTVRGAFGRPGETLLADLAAPQLAPFGLDGGIVGSLRLDGTLAAPAGSLQVQAERLTLPGGVRMQGLAVAAQAGAKAGDPLHIDARLANLAVPGQPELVKSLLWTTAGSRQDHHIAATAALAGQGNLRLTARGTLVGGLAGPVWEGSLASLIWDAVIPAQSLHLQQPSALRLARDSWSLGPADLAGKGWQGRLQGKAAAGHVNLAVQARGPQLGRLEGRLEAGLLGAWQLAVTAPWQGNLQAEVSDLAWLGPWLADGVTTSGHLAADLQLAGTPAQPVTSGRLHGAALHLHLVDQGLRLERGELQATLADNRLRVTRLAFDSPLQAPPRALHLAAGDTLGGLTGKPGRLEISGEMRIDAAGATADSAALDVRLDRLGAFQTPEQWVVLSGNGRVAWRDSGLGMAAKLTVDAGYWQLARLGTPQLSDDVVIKSAATTAPSPVRPRLALDVETDLGRHFHFRGAGLQSRLAGSVRLKAEGRDLPRASGFIRTVGGRFDAYGQQLEIERGILNFAGLLENPGLNVRAVRRGLTVEPGVEVSGSAKRPVVRLVSDPEMADAEKLSWLILGHGSEQGGAGDISVLLSAAGAILGGEAGGVVQQLKRTFGLDEFGVRAGQVGDSGSRQTTSRVAGSGATGASAGEQIVSVGKRLSSTVLLSYEQALGKTESIVKLTVRLTRGLSVIGRAGSDNAIDLFYNFRFGR